jgi:hypothetical protein
VSEKGIPERISVWRDAENDCVLILADPDLKPCLLELLEAATHGDLDRVEAWWHAIAIEKTAYEELYKGSESQIGLSTLRDQLREQVDALAGSSRNLAVDQEHMVSLYNKINRNVTNAAGIRARIQAWRINLEEECRQLSCIARAFGDCRVRQANLPLEQIRLDLATVRPQLDTARAFLAADMEEHTGLLALVVVPMAMMQVVLAILQICWSVAHDTHEGSWMHPVWTGLGHVAPYVLVAIVLLSVPGISYALKFAQKHQPIRSIGLTALLMLLLAFLLPLMLVMVALLFL